MGSSARKKKEKKKDFQKPKLKVGKARPKPANQTDTNFRSKAIVLNQQSLHIDAPSSESRFSHHLSLLTSKSDPQRRDSLSWLTSHIHALGPTQALPVPAATLIAKVAPLVLDRNNSVRVQLLKLLRLFQSTSRSTSSSSSPHHPTLSLPDHAATFLPYLRAGLTSLSPDIRNSAIETLSFLLTSARAGPELVSAPGAFTRILETLITILGWQDHASATGSVDGGYKFSRSGKANARMIVVLAEFIEAGISTVLEDGDIDGVDEHGASGFPYWHTEHHLIPRKSNPYGYLRLFAASDLLAGQTTTSVTSTNGAHQNMAHTGSTGATDTNQAAHTAILDDPEERLRVFDRLYRDVVMVGVERARREGGEEGRAASALAKVLLRP